MKTLTLLATTLLAATLTACAADDDVGPGDPMDPMDPMDPVDDEPTPSYAGTWSGTTDDGGPVTFVISEDDVATQLSLELEINIGVGTCTGTFTAVPDLELADGVLAYDGSLSNGGGSVAATVDALFGADSVTGEYDVSSFSIVCGDSFAFGTGGPAGTFTATRQD